MDKLKKKPKIIDRILVYSLILIALLVFLGLLIQNANSNYQAFKQNKNYFKVSPEYQVQDWMTPRTVLRHFNISEEQLINVLNISKSEKNFRTPIQDLCKRQRKNCVNVIEELNLLVKQ